MEQDAKAMAREFTWLAKREGKEPEFYYQAYIDDMSHTWPTLDVMKAHAIWLEVQNESRD